MYGPYGLMPILSTVASSRGSWTRTSHKSLVHNDFGSSAMQLSPSSLSPYGPYTCIPWTVRFFDSDRSRIGTRLFPYKFYLVGWYALMTKSGGKCPMGVYYRVSGVKMVMRELNPLGDETTNTGPTSGHHDNRAKRQCSSRCTLWVLPCSLTTRSIYPWFQGRRSLRRREQGHEVGTLGMDDTMHRAHAVPLRGADRHRGKMRTIPQCRNTAMAPCPWV